MVRGVVSLAIPKGVLTETRVTSSDENMDPRLQALTKQLSQLGAVGSKIWETSRSIADLQSSTKTKVDLMHAPQQLRLLRELRCKLQATDAELRCLDADDTGFVELAASSFAKQSMRSFGTYCDPTTAAAADVIASNPRDHGTTGVPLHDGGADADSSASTPASVPASAPAPAPASAGADSASVPPSTGADSAASASPSPSFLIPLPVTEAVVRPMLADVVSEQKRASIELVEEKRKLTTAKQETQALRPAAMEVAALEQELADMTKMSEQRGVLQSAINALRPKVALLKRMQSKLNELEAAVEEGTHIAARVADLQTEVDRLPALRQKMCMLEAGAAEVRQLEDTLRDCGRQEESRASLQEKVAELQARVLGIDELKRQVEALQVVAREADQLEACIKGTESGARPIHRSAGSVVGDNNHACSSVGQSRRPQLKDSHSEVEELQQQHSQLKEVSKARWTRINEQQQQQQQQQRHGEGLTAASEALSVHVHAWPTTSAASKPPTAQHTSQLVEKPPLAKCTARTADTPLIAKDTCLAAHAAQGGQDAQVAQGMQAAQGVQAAQGGQGGAQATQLDGTPSELAHDLGFAPSVAGQPASRQSAGALDHSTSFTSLRQHPLRQPASALGRPTSSLSTQPPRHSNTSINPTNSITGALTRRTSVGHSAAALFVGERAGSRQHALRHSANTLSALTSGSSLSSVPSSPSAASVAAEKPAARQYSMRQSISSLSALTRRDPAAVLLGPAASFRDHAALRLAHATPISITLAINVTENVVVGFNLHEPAVQLNVKLQSGEEALGLPAQQQQLSPSFFEHCAPHMEDSLVNFTTSPSHSVPGSPSATCVPTSLLSFPSTSTTQSSARKPSASRTWHVGDKSTHSPPSSLPPFQFSPMLGGGAAFESNSGFTSPASHSLLGSPFQTPRKLRFSMEQILTLGVESPSRPAGGSLESSVSAASTVMPHQMASTQSGCSTVLDVHHSPLFGVDYDDDKFMEDELLLPFAVPDAVMMKQHKRLRVFGAAGAECGEPAPAWWSNKMAMLDLRRSQEMSKARQSQTALRKQEGVLAKKAASAGASLEAVHAGASPLTSPTDDASLAAGAATTSVTRTLDDSLSAPSAVASTTLMAHSFPQRPLKAQAAPKPLQAKQAEPAQAKAVAALEARTAAMQHTLDHKEDLERQLQELQLEALQVEGLRAQVSDLTSIKAKLVEELEQGVTSLSASVRDMEALRQAHAKLVEQHNDLLSLSAESANVPVALLSPAATTPNLDAGTSRVASLAQALEGYSTDDPTWTVTDVENSRRPGTELADRSSAAVNGGLTGDNQLAPTGGPSSPTPIGAVFTRLRVLEAENLELNSEVGELRGKVYTLESSLQSSATFSARLRDVAKTVKMILGRK